MNNFPSQKYSQGKNHLLEILRQWDRSGPHPASDHLQREQAAFAAWKEKLKSDGWTRKDVYDLLNDIFAHHYEEFTENTMDQLVDFGDALVGWCHPDSFERFPGDPENRDAFVAYVRENKWR